MKTALLVIGLLMSSSTLLADIENRTASIACAASDFAISGTVQFTPEFLWYGPALNAVTARFLVRGDDGAVNLVPMKGVQIRGEHYDSPDYWRFEGTGEGYEDMRFNLVQNWQSEREAFAEVFNGDVWPQLRCTISQISTTPSHPQHCHPLGC